MAYTVTKSEATTFGNQRVWQGVVTADAASGVVTMGFGNIAHVQVSPKSMATAAVKVKINLLADGTTSTPGTIGFSSCVSGDDMYVVVFGR